MKIAVDGLAGSGKSTIARRISEELKIPYLETGLAYRAMGYILSQEIKETEQVSWEDIEPFLSRLSIIPKVGKTEIRIEGKVIERELRSEEAGKFASLVGTVGRFREFINEVFRKLIGEGQAVVEGRDAGTNIIPSATVKLFITASPEERARRRVEQLRNMGIEADYEEVLSKIRERDHRDMNRKDYPLKPAEDAIVVDTSGKSIEEVMKEVFSIINRIER